MSSKKGKLRLQKAEMLIAGLQHQLQGYEVRRYSKYHYRIFGETVVDYWPTKNKCWITGSSEKALILSINEVAALALKKSEIDASDWRTEDQRQQLQHIRSIL